MVSDFCAGLDCVCSDSAGAGRELAFDFVARLLISNGVDDGASSVLSLRFVMSRGAVRGSSSVGSAASLDAMIEGATTQTGMVSSPTNAKPVKKLLVRLNECKALYRDRRGWNPAELRRLLAGDCHLSFGRLTVQNSCVSSRRRRHVDVL